MSLRCKRTLKFSLRFFAALALLYTAQPSDLSASPKMPESEWAFANRAALRYNPLGLQNELFIGYKSRLYDKPQDNLLFGKAYWWAGAVSRVSPQFAQTGLFVRALPIAVLELQGILSHVQGISDAADLPSYYTQGTKDAVATSKSAQKPSGNLIGSGWQMSLQARLQAKVKNIALRSTNLMRRFDLDFEGAPQGEELFYDQTLDLVTPQKSWVYQNDVDLLYTDAEKPWVLGARYTYTQVLSASPEQLLDDDALYSIQRAGLLFAWKFDAPATAEGLEAPKRHALIVLSQWHLSHPFRTGQSMNTAIPYFAVVYSFSGRVSD
jgi:hypothetical protein